MPILLFVFIWSLQAIAGPITSGGGNAVVCRGSDGKIQSAELLDLYEAREKYHLSLPPASGDAEADFVAAYMRNFRRFGLYDDPSYLALVERNSARSGYVDFYWTAQFTNEGERLPNLVDHGPLPPIPNGCSVEQLAIFNFKHGNGVRERFRVAKEIYDALDSLNRAALAAHEVNHERARAVGEPNSVLTRSHVAYDFTDASLPPVHLGMKGYKNWWESIGGYGGYSSEFECGTFSHISFWKYMVKFYVIPSPSGRGKRLQFSYIGTRDLVTQTFVDLPEVNWSIAPVGDESSPPLVIEQGIDIRKLLPFASAQQIGLELEIQYKTGEPIRTVIFFNGEEMFNGVVRSCKVGHP